MSRRLALLATAVCALLVLGAQSAAAQEAVEYYATDALGSVRVVFASNGTVKGRMDFGPYGEQLTSAEGIGQKVFAQITFDGESAMDYAEARMFQLRTGRFNAADPVFDAVQNPQKWNRYSYGLNNPQMFVDPGGRNAASGVEAPWSSFCGAEHSFSDCGGDRLFWADALGGGGGLFEFGGGYANAVRQGYDPSMPADMWLGLAEHNRRVEQAFAGQSSRSPTPVVTTSIDTMVGPDGQAITPPKEPQQTPLGRLIGDIGARAAPVTELQTYAEFYLVSAAGGLFMEALGAGNLGLQHLWQPNARGIEIAWSRNFRTGWHRLPEGDYPGAGRNLPHYHRRPGIGNHRPWEGGW